MTLSPKENYIRTLDGEIPEYVPSFFDPYMMPVTDEMLTPNSLPDGKPFVTSLGVTYVGSAEINYGAMPKPGEILIDDITKWRDILKIRDTTGRDWEGYYKKREETVDRSKMCLCVDGGDYFLSLVSLMGFEGALLACYEEPEEVIALLTEISKFYTMVLKKQMQYLKPDIYILMDDDAAYRAPFFSLDIYHEIFKPFHKLHCDIVRENGCRIVRHDCGRSEQFVEDWQEIGVVGWNPFQTSNDCAGIKKKYGDRLTLEGGWDNLAAAHYTDDELIAHMDEYCNTFLPGGRATFSVHAGGFGGKPNPQGELIKQYYEDHVRNWYKTH